MGAGAGPASRAARVEARDARALRRSWAQLIKRIYEADPLVCPNCGGEMRIIAFIISWTRSCDTSRRPRRSPLAARRARQLFPPLPESLSCSRRLCGVCSWRWLRGPEFGIESPVRGQSSEFGGAFISHNWFALLSIITALVGMVVSSLLLRGCS